MPTNPFAASDPDLEMGLIPRREVELKLQSSLIHTRFPSCVSIIAERGMGGRAAVQQFLTKQRDLLPFRVVIWDAKNLHTSQRSAAAFYQVLIRQAQEQLQPLPVKVKAAAEAILAHQEVSLQDIRTDFFTFFHEVKAADEPRPLLLVFYNFDYLLNLFDFAGLDWVWLRQLYDEQQYRAYFVIVSRRPLEYIEKKGRLNDSNFASRFAGNALRIGLLNKREADMVLNKVSENFDPNAAAAPPRIWPPWLRRHLLFWSGHNPYCLEYSCHILFDRLWNHEESLAERNKQTLANDLIQNNFLGGYFRRLYKSLEKDQLLTTLTKALTTGYNSAEHDVLEELWDMGYFKPLPELLPLPEREFGLFSPLFHQYLLNRQIPLPPLKTTLPYDPDSPPIQMPAHSRENLTPREIDVICCILEGHTSDEKIAAQLFIAESTVKDHIKHIRGKLELSGRSELIEYILRHQL